MKYNIISINDDRRIYKDAIRLNVPFAEVNVPTFNAYEHDPIEGIRARGLSLGHNDKSLWQWTNAKRGELGVWLSNYDAWAYCDMLGEPLIVFEDDAVVRGDFDWKFERLMEQVPDDWDFVSLWVPGNQLIDYDYDVSYDEHGSPRINGHRGHKPSYYEIPGNDIAAFVYQGYGMVSLVYSPNGARKLVDLAHERGLSGPVDCWIYEEAHKGNLKGYAPTPWNTPIVDYDWNAQSHVQLTESAL